MDAHRASNAARYKALGAARVPPTKKCSMCRQILPSSEFSRYAPAADGLRTYCLVCDRVVRRAGKYGLTRERVCDMLTQGRCEACDCALAETGDRHIDHRHSDGAVRGILCERCNTTLGKVEESPEILMGICRYIERTMGVDYRKQPYLKQKCVSLDNRSAGQLTPEEPVTLCQTNTQPQQISPRP